jgi:hypothetical protein
MSSKALNPRSGSAVEHSSQLVVEGTVHETVNIWSCASSGVVMVVQRRPLADKVISLIFVCCRCVRRGHVRSDSSAMRSMMGP